MLALTVILGLILAHRVWFILKYNVIRYPTGNWKLKISKSGNLILISFHRWLYYSNAEEYIKRLDKLVKFAKEDPEGFKEFTKKTLGK